MLLHLQLLCLLITNCLQKTDTPNTREWKENFHSDLRGFKDMFRLVQIWS
jgi:hypothetical protein